MSHFFQLGGGPDARPIEPKNRKKIVWGAKAIGKVVNLDERRAFHALEKGYLPARKVGRKWASDEDALLATVLPEAS